MPREIDPDDPQELVVSDEERIKRRKVQDKTSGKDLQRTWENDDRKVIVAAEKAIAPPIIVEPRCNVCQSPYRIQIERLLVKALSYSSIAASLPDEGEDTPDRRSIANHYKKHMAIQDAVIRGVLEEEAALINQNFEEGVKGAMTHRGLLEVVVRKTYDDIINGVVTAEVRDVVQIIKLLGEMNSNSANLKTDQTEAQFRFFVRAIQNVCDDQTRVAIASEVKRLREMDDVEYEMEESLSLPPPIEVNIEDANVVDNEPPLPAT